MTGTLLLASLLITQGAASPNLVVATGAAEKIVDADSAKVFLYTNADDLDAAVARKSVRANAERIVASLKRSPLDGIAYRIDDPSTNAEYEQTAVVGGPSAAMGFSEARKFARFHAFERITVQIDDLRTLPEFIRNATLTEGASVSSVSYGVRDETGLRTAVLRNAFEDARRTAEETASAMGLHLGDVYLADVGSGPTVVGSSLSGNF